MYWTRREWLASAASVALVPATQPEPLETTRQQPLQTLPYGSVTLSDGPLLRQFDQNHQFFLNLSEDRLLKIYRQRAGLPAPGENMGGWYDDFCPGAHFGQYVSALARFAAATNSQETRAKADRLVAGYAATLDSSGKIFDDLRYPAYTYDKLVCMLIDAHTWTGNRQASAILQQTTRAARPHMPEKALTQEEKLARSHKDDTYTWDETYTLAENLFLAYERLGSREYFDMGRRYLLDRTFFDPLANGENVLPGLHAYSHVNALSSGMQGYFKLQDPKYLRAVSNAVEMIWKDQSFATGGWGPNEGFVKPDSGALGASLTGTHRSFETPCGAYAHMKLMRYLLGLTGDTRYGDSMERVIYNTVLGAKPIRPDGWSFYYSDYHDSGFKTDHRVVPESQWPWDKDGRWPCCSGTLPQAAADYTVSIYFRSSDGLWTNLYVPSRVTWTQASSRITLTQQTNYPLEDLVQMKLEMTRPAEFELAFRIPAWAGPNTAVTVNGKRAGAAVMPGRFCRLQREWRSGNRVAIEFDQRLGVQPVDNRNPNRVAITRGPLVLFGNTADAPPLTRSDCERLATVVRKTATGWELAANQGQSLPLRPFWQIGDERYQTYWNVKA